MPPQEEHEKVENLVDAPGQAAHTARSLAEAADSNHTLQCYFAIDDVKDVDEMRKRPLPIPAIPIARRAIRSLSTPLKKAGQACLSCSKLPLLAKWTDACSDPFSSS